VELDQSFGCIRKVILYIALQSIQHFVAEKAPLKPQDDFDGLFGLATMGFRRVSFDFENGLFGWE
jgi:hypothetical protein